MYVVYANESLEGPGPWVFLAGPTPRSTDVKSWRPEAIELFESIGFSGTLFIPEPRDGKFTWDYVTQVDWEGMGLDLCDCIMFWIPRDMETMPAMTTNIEWGTWHKSGKCILGAPPDAPKMGYIRHYATRLGIPQALILKDTVSLVLKNYGLDS